MTNQENLLILNNDLFLGEGRKRKTYAHPIDKNLCIKISSQRGQRSAQREINYFKRLHKRKVSFAMIADFKGKAYTNFGEGDMYELVRDYDGNISKNLEYYLSLNDKKITTKIVQLIDDLRIYLKEQYILFSDLALDNILIQKSDENKYKLVIIDGLGDNNQVPILEYIKSLGTKRNTKKWEIFKSKIIQKFPNLEKNIKNFNDED